MAVSHAVMANVCSVSHIVASLPSVLISLGLKIQLASFKDSEVAGKGESVAQRRNEEVIELR